MGPILTSSEVPLHEQSLSYFHLIGRGGSHAYSKTEYVYNDYHGPLFG